MTDTHDQSLANSAFALLAQDTVLVVFDGFVPKGTVPPYVVVYTDITRPSGSASNADTLDGITRHWSVAWYCHCVGRDAVGDRAVAQRVRTQLLDRRPPVLGFDPMSVGLIRQVDASPAQRNETTGALVMSALQVYELYASQ